MKFFALFIFLLTSWWNLSNPSSEPPIWFEISRVHWEACETGGNCPPLVFKRLKQQATVYLKVPCGGTITEVTLSRAGELEPIQHLHLTVDKCPPVFDLSALPDGNYSLYMLACGLGGGVSFQLQTKV